jgi:hypothetical protein
MTDGLRSPIDDPASYPGTPVARSCVVAQDKTYELADGREVLLAADEVLRELQAAPISQRFPVLAIGSNAGILQLKRKFARLSAWTVPVTLVNVTGLGVAYSAHISRPGYVPWAPYLTRSNDVETYRITWLTAEEVAVLDATEPNYSPTELEPKFQVTTESGQVVEGVKVYKGRWGVLGDDSGIIPASDQSTALGLVSRFFGRAVTQEELAQDQALRTAVTEALRFGAYPDGLNGSRSTPPTSSGIESTQEVSKQ